MNFHSCKFTKPFRDENRVEEYADFFHLKEDEKYVNSMRFYVPATGYKELCITNFSQSFVKGESGF